MKTLAAGVTAALLATSGILPGQPTGATPVPEPRLYDFRPLPAADPSFTEEIAALVAEAGLDTMTPADENVDQEDEWSSVCVVDLSSGEPVVAEWKADNFLYPASTYKMYVLGEAVRQAVEGEVSLDQTVTIDPNNVRNEPPLLEGVEVSLSEVLRLMVQESSNTAANEAIDLTDRRRVSALMHALGCEGSEVTRKFLPRSREDEGWAEVESTETCAAHMATFLWAVEQGAVGGGRGRALIKGYLATCETDTDRFRAGIPDSATLYAKTGEWSNFTAEAAIIEDGDVQYILCVMTPYPRGEAAPRMAAFAKSVHELVKERAEETE